MNPSTRYTPKTPKRTRSNLSSGSDNEGKDPVNVFCRLRALQDDKRSPCINLLSSTTLSLNTELKMRKDLKDAQFKFKHIFTSFSTQKEVFDHVAYPLLQDLLNGKNGLLFTYGVTGSGKTYTLTGELSNPGIMPRCINTLFNTIGEFQAPKFVIKSDKMNGFEIQTEDDALQDRLMQTRSVCRTPRSTRRANGDRVSYVNEGVKISNINENNLYAVFVTYIEIYNNIVFDLLDESSGKTLQSKILREDSCKNMYVNGVVEVEVKSSEEAFDVFNMGQRRKRMGHTNLNAESSRSHSIFNLRVVQLEQNHHNMDKPLVPDSNMLKIAQLSLVDLAGSERTNRTNNTGMRLKEASSINNSLMNLRTCLEVLRENQLMGSNKLVPYRDSRLTLLFKNYFEGEGSVGMIVCIHPSEDDLDENLHVLKFAEMSKDVKINKGESRYTPYRKVAKKMLDTPKTKSHVTQSIVLPKLPGLKLNFDNPEERFNEIERLGKLFKIRQERSRQLDVELTKKEKHFRKRLVEMNEGVLLDKNELKTHKILLKKERHRAANLETKVMDSELVNDKLTSTNNELQNVIRSLHQKINEKDLKLNQNVIEKEEIKEKAALDFEKCKKEHDENLRRQRQHLEKKSKVNDYKLHSIQQLIHNTQPPAELYETENIDPVVNRLKPVSHHIATPSSKDSAYRRNLQTCNSSARRRRSRSANDVWLEHNSIKPVALGTILQPAMKKRKSVTKVTKADDITNPKQSKYCLIAQEPDTDGEMETRVYKADILQTCGGGAQVVFNDVERLKQESPTASPNK